jgi:metal-dependent amidase/aminoacylase/carboxypeptidase family protein
VQQTQRSNLKLTQSSIIRIQSYFLRRDFHQNPELENEFKTAEKIAAHLRSLGIEVQTGIAKQALGILREANQDQLLLFEQILMFYP